MACRRATGAKNGHNRYEICTRHGIEYSTVEKEFESREEIKIWIKDNQASRRNLPPFLRAEYRMDVDEWKQRKQQAKENKVVAIAEARQSNPKNENEQFFVNSQKTVRLSHYVELQPGSQHFGEFSKMLSVNNSRDYRTM